MDERGRIELTKRGYRAFTQRDIEAMTQLMHPEAELHAVTGIVAHQSEPYVGRRGLEEYLADVERVWDELRLLPQEFTPLEGERVLVSGRVVVKRGATRLDLPNAWLWEFDGDLVRRIRILSDPQGIERLREERTTLEEKDGE